MKIAIFLLTLAVTLSVQQGLYWPGASPAAYYQLLDMFSSSSSNNNVEPRRPAPLVTSDLLEQQQQQESILAKEDLLNAYNMRNSLSSRLNNRQRLFFGNLFAATATITSTAFVTSLSTATTAVVNSCVPLSQFVAGSQAVACSPRRRRREALEHGQGDYDDLTAAKVQK